MKTGLTSGQAVHNLHKRASLAQKGMGKICVYKSAVALSLRCVPCVAHVFYYLASFTLLL